MWGAVGIGLAVLGAVAALVRAARSGTPGYDADGYGMTARSHLRFAWLSGAFVALFALTLAFGGVPTAAVALVAVYVLALVLYASSFARGSSH